MKFNNQEEEMGTQGIGQITILDTKEYGLINADRI